MDKEHKQESIQNTIVKNENDIEESKFSIIGEVSYRWIIFICFFLLSFANGFQWLVISNISKNFSIIYEKDIFVTNLFSISYMIVFPIIFPLSAYIIENKSIKFGIILSAILNSLGAFTKIFINKSFGLALFGQFLSAIAQPFIICACAKISSIWFRSKMVINLLREPKLLQFFQFQIF